MTRILFDRTRAVGVACAVNHALREFRAEREVILSAGALQSPKILQLSGIGPADHLRSFKLPVICDSPGVGANLRDHWGLRLQYSLFGASDHNWRLRRIMLWMSVLRYLMSRTGVLSTAGAEIGASVKAMPGRFPSGCRASNRHSRRQPDCIPAEARMHGSFAAAEKPGNRHDSLR